MVEQLRQQVLEANLELERRGLVIYTFGNASGIDRAAGRVAIKPSGVPYDKLRAEDLVVTDLDGRVVEGRLKPSSDLATHIALYHAFPAIGGVVHTHSRYATAWAQAGREIPCLGTTHADYFRGPVPLTSPLSAEDVAGDYEANTGSAIVRRLQGLEGCPAALVAGHGPFCWGPSPMQAAEMAVLLEELARLAYYTVTLNAAAPAIPDHLRDRHYLRKHGPAASYGQSAAPGSGTGCSPARRR